MSSYIETIPKVTIEDISAVTNHEIWNANEYQMYRENISYIETVPSQADDSKIEWTANGHTILQRVGRLPTYKPFHYGGEANRIVGQNRNMIGY